MNDLRTALARLEAAGIELPAAVAQWSSWFHGDAPFAARSVVSDTADAAIFALADLAGDLLVREPVPGAAELRSVSQAAPAPLVTRLSA